MKSQLRQGPAFNVLCKDHKQKCSIVCLQKMCSQSFKIGCSKCRKDHAQHPNRIISLNDFHNMYSFFDQENSTAFKLMNLKKKIQYIRNFRTSILEKEVQLIDSNGNIKSTITSILQEHYKIRSVVSHIDTESLLQNSTEYTQYLLKCKEFMAFNPVKGDLVFNNDVIKSSRVTLQKHLKKSHQLIDNIRQFLVKIIEVLLANCAYEEDDDDIEFQNEGDNPTNFNIFIKTRTDASENPNIKNKLEHQTFLQMFDEQKQALNQEIQILEKELHVKVNILNKIRCSSQITKQINPPQSYQPEIELNLERVQSQRVEMKGSKKLRYTADTTVNKDKINNEIIELKEEYETILSNKQEYIQQLRQTCSSLQSKIGQIKLQSKKKENELVNMKQLQQARQKMKQEQKQKIQQLNDKLKKAKESLEKRQSQIKSLQHRYEKQKDTNHKLKSQKEEALSKKQNQIKTLKNKLQSIERRANARSQQHKSKEIQKLTKNDQELKIKISKMEETIAKKEEAISKKDAEIQKHKKKYADLQNLIQKMNQNSQNSQKELMQWRNQHQQREKMLREELEYSHKEIDQLHSQISQANKKIRQIESTNTQKTTQMSQLLQKTELIVQQQKQLAQKEQKLKKSGEKIKQKEDLVKMHNKQSKEKQQQLKLIKIKQSQLEWQLQMKTKKYSDLQKEYETQILRQSKKTQSTLKTAEEENKKIKEMKEMLEISIRKNQELKDRNYQLQNDLINLKEQSSQANIPHQRRAFCQSKNGRINNKEEQAQTAKLETVNSQFIDPPSPTFKKKGIENTSKVRKNNIGKQDKKQVYLEIKSIFKAVTEDIGVLQERVKENTVIQKVYLKELERKRNQNKTLKKELQNIKLYGSNFKTTDVERATSPSHKDKMSHNSPLSLHPVAQSQSGITKKYPKGAK